MTVYKRGNSYGVSLYDPVAKGMRWVGTRPTRELAEELERQAAAGETCDAYAARWPYDGHARPSEETNSTYAKHAQRFGAAFRSIPIRSLAPTDAVRWAAAQPTGVWEVARTLMNDAIADGLHPGPNPLSRLRASRRLRPPSPLSEEELFELAETAIAVHGDYGLDVFAPLLIATAFLRLSVSEICSLRKEDVHDQHVLLRGDGIALRVDMVEEAARALAAVQSSSGDTSRVFASKRGRPLSRSRLYYYWTPVRAAFGQHSLRFDELRFFWVPRYGIPTREVVTEELNSHRRVPLRLAP